VVGDLNFNRLASKPNMPNANMPNAEGSGDEIVLAGAPAKKPLNFAPFRG